MKKVLLILLLLSFKAGFANEAEIIFKQKMEHPHFDFLKQEIKEFLNSEFLNDAGDNHINEIVFNFIVDKQMELATFAVNASADKYNLNINLTGQTTSDVLYAAYTFLEKGGYVFDITGPVCPKKFMWTAVKKYSEKIVPAVKKRGIREHLNFTMDISSWSLNDAKKYIQNLSRMRFNYITFHSYPGQWYEVVRKDTFEYAGNFFYGDTHLVPDNATIKGTTTNNKYFCIPEIEPFFKDKAARSKKAIAWLQEVMKEAKRTGMGIQMSFEPRSESTDVQATIETIKAIYTQYPLIDALEFITSESGGWGPRASAEQIRENIKKHFGAEFLNDTILTNPIKDNQPDLSFIYGQIGHNEKVISYLKKNKILPFKVELKIGIYVVMPENARAAFHLARKIAPETQITIMPGHHSSKVKNNIPLVVKSKADWDKSIIYSWIEFDGMMYIQQNGISGIKDIVQLAVNNSTDHRATAILYNHWRTAENRITARYAAVSSLYGAIDPALFYADYAKACGITNNNQFALALQKLSDADLTGMENVSGFGFCWVGRWKKGGPLTVHSVEKLQVVKNAFQNSLDQLKLCASNTNSADGHQILALLQNRIETTIIYIEAFQKARELIKFNVKEPLSDTDKAAYNKICYQSLAYLNQYIEHYAEINADTGTPGQLISLYNGPINGLKYFLEKNGGVIFEKDEEVLDKAIDAPPLPTINNKLN